MFCEGDVNINKRSLGSHYEEAACDYLIQNGITILCRNFYARQGEIDIVGTDGNYLIFFEVKYRKDLKYGYPGEALTPYKIKSLISTSRYYLYKNGYAQSTPIRYDCILILGNTISHIKNAFNVEV